jgi:hypothetical protein
MSQEDLNICDADGSCIVIPHRFRAFMWDHLKAPEPTKVEYIQHLGSVVHRWVGWRAADSKHEEDNKPYPYPGPVKAPMTMFTQKSPFHQKDKDTTLYFSVCDSLHWDDFAEEHNIRPSMDSSLSEDIETSRRWVRDGTIQTPYFFISVMWCACAGRKAIISYTLYHIDYLTTRTNIQRTTCLIHKYAVSATNSIDHPESCEQLVKMLDDAFITLTLLCAYSTHQFQCLEVIRGAGDVRMWSTACAITKWACYTVPDDPSSVNMQRWLANTGRLDYLTDVPGKLHAYGEYGDDSCHFVFTTPMYTYGADAAKPLDGQKLAHALTQGLERGIIPWETIMEGEMLCRHRKRGTDLTEQELTEQILIHTDLIVQYLIKYPNMAEHERSRLNLFAHIFHIPMLGWMEQEDETLLEKLYEMLEVLTRSNKRAQGEENTDAMNSDASSSDDEEPQQKKNKKKTRSYRVSKYRGLY